MWKDDIKTFQLWKNYKMSFIFLQAEQTADNSASADFMGAEYSLSESCVCLYLTYRQ